MTATVRMMSAASAPTISTTPVNVMAVILAEGAYVGQPGEGPHPGSRRLVLGSLPARRAVCLLGVGRGHVRSGGWAGLLVSFSPWPASVLGLAWVRAWS
ncbi:MAG: hypothetical protein M3Y26_00705 [Actinomycetota bacterium]|nr:hypothetical protein [Actinomycetota bacterium]